VSYTTRIPEIISKGRLGTQRAVEFAGQEVEFLALSTAEGRRMSGAEVSKIKWKVNSRNPFQGAVRAGTFYTRFSEFGTVHQSAHPIFGPAADRVRPHFISSVTTVWKRA
jgi:HK97 gp10 family phage protein